MHPNASESQRASVIRFDTPKIGCKVSLAKLMPNCTISGKHTIRQNATPAMNSPLVSTTMERMNFFSLSYNAGKTNCQMFHAINGEHTTQSNNADILSCSKKTSIGEK